MNDVGKKEVDERDPEIKAYSKLLIGFSTDTGKNWGQVHGSRRSLANFGEHASWTTPEERLREQLT
jgi:hypothetical protein